MKKNKGADFPKSSSSFLGYGQATFHVDKYGKVHALHGHGTLHYLFSHVENWPYSRRREQEQIALCIFMSRESVVAHPS